MQLSTETKNILKSMSQVNPSIVLKPGSTISTISNNSSVFMRYESADIFDGEYGIYNLNQFLQTLSLFKNPELKFSDNFVVIEDDKSSCKFIFAETSLLKHPSKDNIDCGDPVFDFNLPWEKIAMLTRASSVISVNILNIKSTDMGDIEISLYNPKDASAISYNLPVGKTDKSFDLFLEISNMQLHEDDYTVHVYNQTTPIATFSGQSVPVKYWIALGVESKIG